MSTQTDRQGDAGHRPPPPPRVETERLVVVRRDRFAAFAVLAQAYAGQPGVRLVWDRRRRDRRASAATPNVGDRRQRDRRSAAALAVNDYLVFTREQLREPGRLAFVHHLDMADTACRPTAGDDIRREIDAAAQSELPILITGGDTISRRSLARRLHDRSARSDRQFRVIDRQTFLALSDDWMSGRRIDLGGLAGGTVFVEEVAHWTLAEQVQFSDRLEQLARVRSTTAPSPAAPMRILSGSACCLIDLVNDRHFRAELFYRLNMVHLVLPSGMVRAMV
jgi:transcriptional regulator of acetoin/glycerol metabolism